MKAVKVLHFSSSINRDDAIDAVIRYFPEKAIRIEVATLTSKSLIADTDYEGIGILHHKLLSKYNYTYLDYLVALIRLYRTLRRHQIDIIHVHLFWTSIVATLARFMINFFHNKNLKIIIHRHYTHDIDYLPRHKRFFLKLLEYISYKYADSIVVPTNTIKKVISMEYDEHILNKVSVIPYCFNFSSDKYRNIDRKCVTEFRSKSKTENAFIIVNVGSHRWQKGQHILINSFAEFLKLAPNAKLWLIGAGPETDRFKQLASSLGLLDGDNPPCKFWGFRPADQVKLFVSASDLFVHPTFSEAFPQVMIEALIWGIPLIITPVSGAIDYLEHKKHAWFVPMNDSISLTAAIVELWEKPELRSQMSKEGRELVLTKFNSSDILPRYNELYKKLA